MNRKILVPLDGSELAEQILPYAEHFGRTGSEIHLLRVVVIHAIHKMAREEVEAHALKEARDYLRYVERKLGKKGLKAESHVLLGEPAETILEFAERERCDLIALTTHGLSGIGRWLIGSVAERIVRSSAIPVFVVRAKQP